MEALMEKFS